MLSNLLAETGAENTVNPVTYGLIIVVIALMIFYLVWSSIKSKKQQAQAQEQINKLKVGDRVKTIGGVCGFVYEINNSENTFVLETGTDTKKSYVKFDKGAIYQTAPHDGNAVSKEENTEEVTETKEDVKGEDAPKEEKTAVKKTKTTKEERREDVL